ncbi:MAG: T9SS type B sorting domain-containing protein [Sphingobacteriales bacterium]|nr:MAG: T9SS type B sorting domain-containing protein [Sphingobacteriales bacterium]
MLRFFTAGKRILFSMAFLLCCAITSNASHFYGADLFYTYVSGNTYKITFVAYGDCDGSAFSTFASSTPEIEITDQLFYNTTTSLTLQAPTAGTEVTPVCPSQLSNTRCASPTGTLPGVKKFTYSGNVTLPHTSANWLFTFNGVMGFNLQSGRSNTITNIVPGTLMALQATLDNSSAPNTSPTSTTIPTPFFCINKPASYNPGAVDSDADSLDFQLVDGLVGATSPSISYISPRTGSSPLTASTGTFNFSNTTGQLNFTPSNAQRSLVVNKTIEYRNGVAVGSSMREMTFVVISPCSNNPPGGTITNHNSGTLVDTVTLKACKSNGTVTFNINPTDLDGDGINMVANGLPAGASFTVTNNNTSSPTGAFSWNITNVAAGTYTFFVTYTDDGCPLSSKQTMAYSIIVLPIPGISFQLVSAATCTKKAVFKVTPSGTSSPFTFTVRQGTTIVHTISSVTAQTTDSVAPGTYTLRFENTNGCYKDTSITFVSPPTLFLSASMSPPFCHGGNNGRITLNPAGGLSPYRFAMGTGTYSANNVFTGLTPGSYTLSVKDGNDCITSINVTVTDPADMIAQIAVARPTCNFFGNGTIAITTLNGTSPYQYAVGSGAFSTTNTFTGLSGGNYTIHIKDANGCLKDSIYTLKDSIVVHAAATVTNVLCNGDNTGTITLMANGGTPAYQYKLGSGTLGTTNTFSPLTAGNYSFHIEDQYKCFLDTVVTITEPAKLVPVPAITNVLCNGGSTGTVTVTGTGGVTPYTFASGSGTYTSSGAYTGFSVGTYTFHIKDANQCVKDTTINITEPTKLIISNIVAVDANCYNSLDGSFTVTASGGTPGYTYAANTGTFGTSNILGNLPAGTHTIHLKDANGCLVDSVRSLLQPTRIVPSVSLRNSTCSDLRDGRVTLSATGGSPGYTYAMNAGTYTTSATFTSLNAATYTFHVKDAHGCIRDTLIAVIDSLHVRGNINVTDANCNREASGMIQIQPVGGEAPYQYALNSNPFANINVFGTLMANTYTVHIKDVNGCTKDTTIIITEPTRIVPSVVLTHEICYKYNNGSIQVSATGGVPSYAFALDANAYSPSGSFSTLFAGTYTVHVQDAHGCIHDTLVTLTEPPGVDINSVNITNVLCFGEASGVVVVNASGGNPPLQYSPDQVVFQTSKTLTGFTAGDHFIRVKDVNNCFRDTLVRLTEPPVLLIDAVTVTNPTCEGFADGEVSIVASGGTSAYRYAYANNASQSSPLISNVLEGTYAFSVIDNNGCKHDTTLTLTGYPHINIDDTVVTPVSCFGYEDGVIAVEASGGVQPLQYAMGSVQKFEPQFTGLKAGEHTITVIDNKNCKKDVTATVGTPDELTIKLLATPNDCEGLDNGGAITTDVKGGTEPYSFVWSNNAAVPELRGISNGVYTAIVRDAHECTDSATARVAYDNCCKIFIPDAFTPNGDGKNDKIKVMFKGDMELKVFFIFNRFGQKVFTTKINGDGWDGMLNGTPQDLGTYNYYVQAICGNAGTKEVEFKGTITLIR